MLAKQLWNEAKEQNVGFLPLLAGTFDASSLGSMFLDKGVIWDGEGVIWAGEVKIRAGHDF